MAGGQGFAGLPLAARLTYIDGMTRNPIHQSTGNNAMHRLQIGLVGVVMVLAMVGMADMLLQGASNERPVGERADVQDGADAAAISGEATPAAAGRLVDLGVVPDLPADEAAQPLPAQTDTGEAVQRVPDLPAKGQPRPTPSEKP